MSRKIQDFLDLECVYVCVCVLIFVVSLPGSVSRRAPGDRRRRRFVSAPTASCSARGAPMDWRRALSSAPPLQVLPGGVQTEGAESREPHK